MDMEEKVLTIEEEILLEEKTHFSDQPIPFCYILAVAAFVGIWGTVCLISAFWQYGLSDVFFSFLKSIGI